MLTIGEFSRLCNISTKTLRYYDNINLLKPASIDKNNDYRYYEIGQLKDVLIINKLKEYLFSLSEILEILENNDSSYILKQLERKRLNMEKQIEKQKNILKSMENDIKKMKECGELLELDINPTIIEVSDINIVSIRKKIKEKYIGELFNDLALIINKDKLEVYGSPITIFHDKEYDENKLVDMEIAIPVLESCGKNIRVLKGGKYIYIKSVGDYEKLRSTIIKLYIWKDENRYEIDGTPYEKYIKGSHNSKKLEEYITEVYLPIK